MEDIKLNITPSGDGTLTILQGSAPTPLPERDIQPLRFIGQIDVVGEYIAKKKELIPVVHSHVAVEWEKGAISLISSETEYCSNIVTGTLTLSEDMNVFSINEGKRYSTFDLAHLIRMNRYYFTDKSTAMALVSDLKNFKAKISRDLEKSDNGQGNAKLLKEQVVDHNIPQSFQLTFNIFQRVPPVSFMVDVIVDPDSLEVSLESPELREHHKTLREKMLSEQVDRIRELLPDLAILNK